MTEAVVSDLIVLPPVADDPIFCESLPECDQATRQIVDPHEFAGLYIRHRWSFALHARRFLSDDRDIDEVVQEGFLKLFLALPELETELQALAYGRRTITNLCIDRYRADQRRPRLVDLESIPASALPDDDETDPVIQAEDAAIVREALALLSPLHRDALIKREVEEKPLPQIAEELDLTVEQTKHLLHRARRSLRRLLVGTHVEPGVDLDMAIVLAANRARAVRAAKPTGAAVVALMMVLAGVLGIRSGGSSPRIQGTVDLPRGLPGSLGGVPSDILRPARPTTVTPTARTSPQRGTTQAPARPAAAPVAPRVTSAQPPARAAKPTRVVPVVAQPVAAAPASAPAAPAGPAAATGTETTASSRWTLGGLLDATTAPRIANRQAFTADAGGEAAFSQFLAGTEHGPVVVSQTLSAAPDGSVNYAVDASLPVDGAAVPATLASPDAAVTQNPDGTVTVTVDTAFDLQAAQIQSVPTGSALPKTDRFQIQVLYGADLATVLMERVVIGGPGDPLPPFSTPVDDVQEASGGTLTGSDPAMVRDGATTQSEPDGRNIPEGRDQEPLSSS